MEEMKKSCVFMVLRPGIQQAVSQKGGVLMESQPNTFGLQLDGASERVGYSKWRYWENKVVLPQ
jgi:hypothetical protein